MPASQRQTLLVLRAQCGDRQAFDELLAGVETRLHRYLVGLIGDSHTADDVLQETFVIVWKKLVWLNEPELFKPWMHRIATREAFRRMRRERVALEVELDEATVERTSDVESSVAERSDVLELLPELVAGIPPASRAVVLLHYWEDLSLEKVAEVLDLPLGTAKSRLSYGLAALRRMADRVHRENGARTPGRAR